MSTGVLSPPCLKAVPPDGLRIALGVKAKEQALGSSSLSLSSRRKVADPAASQPSAKSVERVTVSPATYPNPPPKMDAGGGMRCSAGLAAATNALGKK
eukprot:697862-Amphidinium_carterae.1